MILCELLGHKYYAVNGIAGESWCCRCFKNDPEVQWPRPGGFDPERCRDCVGSKRIIYVAMTEDDKLIFHTGTQHMRENPLQSQPSQCYRLNSRADVPCNADKVALNERFGIKTDTDTDTDVKPE